MAVWGLSDDHYTRAVNDLAALDLGFTFDLMQFESAPASLQAVIQRQGVALTMPGIVAADDGFIPNSLKPEALSITMADTAVLFGLIQQELQALEALVHTT